MMFLLYIAEELNLWCTVCLRNEYINSNVIFVNIVKHECESLMVAMMTCRTTKTCMLRKLLYKERQRGGEC